MTPGIIIAAPSSGSGKTTVTLGLLSALRMRGMAVQPFKCGPDYIDPAFHAAASGRASVNLDGWAMGPGLLNRLARCEADIIVAEGAMGLFDGVATPGEMGNGSSADMAQYMGWPVVLVVDCSGQAQSAAAIAQGFARFRPKVQVAGVILNKIASPRHEALVRHGMQEAGIAVLGVLPRAAGITLPERHLGLVQAAETAHLDALLAQAGQIVAQNCDLDAICAAAGGLARDSDADVAAFCPAPGGRIALAKDEAFSFVYPHLIASWRAQGATIIPFSPLADEGPDSSADICWLPGGYPELHGAKLSANGQFHAQMHAFAAQKPVHGECGGYMVLGAAITDKDGITHPMLGLLGLETSFAKRKMHLGYRKARLAASMPGFQPGQLLRGHEFHYASIVAQPDAPLADVYDANDRPVPETGAVRDKVSGSFFHFIAKAG
ncbi:cobyrinic acid a,c-diamide synthase [Thioclava sp. SK-1]|uniref:cobyrinate a,c-diamide synthase n=1 Tax=Thioclava sp. SK-1 TaxID=1889770 RepID=UPI000823FB6F|nr:cobyrinate a,c-diamide synthase [Thioclava sp. SK-1]OCX65994.1 cobyrinic acid a,c-diamide synthase [Thioclava sp. SK-1]